MEYWIAIQYNVYHSHDAKTIGVYTTRKLAEKIILAKIKKEYDAKVNIAEFFLGDDHKEFAPWCECKEIIKKNLRNKKTVGLNHIGYKISKHIVIEK